MTHGEPALNNTEELGVHQMRDKMASDIVAEIAQFKCTIQLANILKLTCPRRTCIFTVYVFMFRWMKNQPIQITNSLSKYTLENYLNGNIQLQPTYTQSTNMTLTSMFSYYLLAYTNYYQMDKFIFLGFIHMYSICLL